MKILVKSECHAWLASHNIEIESAERLALPSQGFNREFVIPASPREQLTLAHQLAQWFDFSQAMFWMSTWPHFEPYEMQLFLQWRQSYGANLSLIEAPGHLFEQRDKASVWAMGELLLFVTAFNWEGYLLEPEQRSVIWMGDDVIEVVTQQEEKDKELQELLDALYVSEIPRENAAKTGFLQRLQKGFKGVRAES